MQAPASILLIADRCGPGEAMRVAPLLRAVPAAHPQARVTLLVGEQAHPVFAGDTAFHRIVVSRLYGRDRPWTRRRVGRAVEAARLLLRLRRRHDLAVTLLAGTTLLDVVGRLAGRTHVGYANRLPGLLLSRRPPWPAGGGEVGAARALLESAGIEAPAAGGVPAVRPDAAASVRRLLAAHGLPGPGGLIVVHTGSDWACQQWPARRWAAAADELARRHAADVVFTGTDADAEHVEDVRRLMRRRSVSVVGRTGLEELAALLAAARLCLTVDSAAHDVAQAVGTPTVVLAAPTEPEGRPGAMRVVNRAAPDLRRAIRGCQLGFPEGRCRDHACPMAGMRGIEPRHVVQAVGERLGPAPGHSPTAHEAGERRIRNGRLARGSGIPRLRTSRPMRMPNFLVIGAAKSGTDALCDRLAQHPDVYVSANKEPNFFVAEGTPEIPYRGPRDREVLEAWDGWVWSLARYQALFADVTTERAAGEGSTWYLYHEDAPRRIRRHVPDARLIAILRNPVDRAYSAFTMMLRDGRETTGSFARALAEEDERVRRNWELLWHYRRMGLYHAQLQRYYATFDPAQVRVVLHDDFVAAPLEVMRDLYRFLDVDDGFEPDVSGRLNVSMVPRHPTYQRILDGGGPLKTVARAIVPSGVRQRVKEKVVYSTMTRPAPLAPELRRHLVDVFRPDVLRLQELLGRDLSRWLR